MASSKDLAVPCCPRRPSLRCPPRRPTATRQPASLILIQSLTSSSLSLPSWTRSQTAPANLFLSHNPSLGPPYRVLVDTNFINHSLQNKLELVQGMMDCLFAKCASPFESYSLQAARDLPSSTRNAPGCRLRRPRFDLLPCLAEHRSVWSRCRRRAPRFSVDPRTGRARLTGSSTPALAGIPTITDCVMAELEKLGPKYRMALKYVRRLRFPSAIALATLGRRHTFNRPPAETDSVSSACHRCPYRIARDPRFDRLPCSHHGTYADDCLVQRVSVSKCYIVATCDRDLRRRIRKVPGVPLMYIVSRRYQIERLPDGGVRLCSRFRILPASAGWPRDNIR